MPLDDFKHQLRKEREWQRALHEVQHSLWEGVHDGTVERGSKKTSPLRARDQAELGQGSPVR